MSAGIQANSLSSNGMIAVSPEWTTWGHGASLLFLRRLLFVHLAMPLFHHRRDAVFAGFPVAVMSPAPATTPHERAQYTEEQEQEEQREQATQESKTETEWAIERWSVVRNRRDISRRRDNLAAGDHPLRDARVVGVDADAHRAHDQHKRKHNSENNSPVHFSFSFQKITLNGIIAVNCE